MSTSDKDHTAEVLGASCAGTVVASVLAVPFFGFAPLVVSLGGLMSGCLVAHALLHKQHAKADDDDRPDQIEW
jgi:hypothetical protein